MDRYLSSSNPTRFVHCSKVGDVDRLAYYLNYEPEVCYDERIRFHALLEAIQNNQVESARSLFSNHVVWYNKNNKNNMCGMLELAACYNCIDMLHFLMEQLIKPSFAKQQNTTIQVEMDRVLCIYPNDDKGGIHPMTINELNHELNVSSLHVLLEWIVNHDNKMIRECIHHIVYRILTVLPAMYNIQLLQCMIGFIKKVDRELLELVIRRCKNLKKELETFLQKAYANSKYDHISILDDLWKYLYSKSSTIQHDRCIINNLYSQLHSWNIKQRSLNDLLNTVRLSIRLPNFFELYDDQRLHSLRDTMTDLLLLNELQSIDQVLDVLDDVDNVELGNQAFASQTYKVLSLIIRRQTQLEIIQFHQSIRSSSFQLPIFTVVQQRQQEEISFRRALFTNDMSTMMKLITKWCSIGNNSIPFTLPHSVTSQLYIKSSDESLPTIPCLLYLLQFTTIHQLQSILSDAIRQGCYMTIFFLLEQGFNRKDHNPNFRLATSLPLTDLTEIITEFINRKNMNGEDYIYSKDDLIHGLLSAAQQGYEKRMILLSSLYIERFGPFTTNQWFHQSLLTNACSGGHLSIICFLLDNSSILFDSNAIIKGIEAAASHGHTEIIQHLIKTIKQRTKNYDNKPNQAIQRAIQGGHFATMMVLRQFGYMYNISDLKHAVQYGYSSVVKQILQENLIRIPWDVERECIRLASMYGWTVVASLIIFHSHNGFELVQEIERANPSMVPPVMELVYEQK